MTAEITTVIGQLSIKDGKWRNNAPNQVAVREPKSADAPGAGKGDLFIVTEVQGDVADTDRLEQKLAQAMRDSYYLSRGSITASLRRAVETGNELLFHYNKNKNVDNRVAGGAVMLVMCQEDAFAAQIGPAALFAVLGDHVQRYPAQSVWLDEALAPGQDEDISALGLSTLVEPRLHHLRVSPYDKLILADSRLAGQLPVKELVKAVESDNVKTAMKKLGKVAQAHNCSALLLEVLEAETTTIGPIKISPPSQLSGLLHRHRSPVPEEQAPAQPAVATAEAPPELSAEGMAHSSKTFTSTSVIHKWFGPFSGSDEPEPAPESPPAAGYSKKPYQPPQKEKDMHPEPMQEPNEMASVAPESMFGQAHRKESSNSGTSLSVGKIFRWLGLGLLTLVALLGSGLKTVLGLILPSGSSHRRQAGMQAQQQPPSRSTWVLLRNIAIAIPILVALVVGINYLQKGRIREAEYQEFISTAQSKFEQAQATNDDAAALGLMTEAETALTKAEEIKETQPEITELRQQMAQEADERGNVHRLYYLPQLRQYTDAGTNLGSIVVQGIEIYVMDAGNDRIYHHRLDDLGESLLPDDDTVVMVSKGQTVENITVNELLGMTWMPTGGNRQTSDLVILNSTGLLEYNPNWGITTSALAGGESLVLPKAVDSFFGNFYVLDPQANSLLRYLPTNDGYSAPPESYFPADQPVDLSSAVDLAIDGAVYVLFSDGRISKFLSGQPVEFNVSGLDVPLNNPVSIFTAPDEEVQHVYVTDAGNQRIVQLNKDGTFVRQFKPRPGEAVTFANLQDIFVDEIGSRMYILDSNNLYVTNLPTEEPVEP